MGPGPPAAPTVPSQAPAHPTLTPSLNSRPLLHPRQMAPKLPACLPLWAPTCSLMRFRCQRRGRGRARQQSPRTPATETTTRVEAMAGTPALSSSSSAARGGARPRPRPPPAPAARAAPATCRQLRACGRRTRSRRATRARQAARAAARATPRYCGSCLKGRTCAAQSTTPKWRVSQRWALLLACFCGVRWLQPSPGGCSWVQGAAANLPAELAQGMHPPPTLPCPARRQRPAAACG